MAKNVQDFTFPGSPDRLLVHLVEHLSNYAQYFSVHQRSPSALDLELRDRGVKRPAFGRPGFAIRVTASGTGSRVVLLRTLAPLGRYFFGLFTGASALALLVGLILIAVSPAEWRKLAPFTGIALGLTLAGLAFRQLYYLFERGQDRELTGIVEKALSDFGRPTAIRRRENYQPPSPSRPQ